MTTPLELYRDNQTLKARIAGHIEHIKSLEAEVEDLRQQKFRRFGNEDCWIYQGDGEDHLESLVCPVVVSPQRMIEFEKAKARIAELEADFIAGVENMGRIAFARSQL